MSLDHGDLVVLLSLLVGVAALVALLPRLAVPFPIPLVLGGLALGFAPGLPQLEMPPDVVLVGVLPPLLYSSAYFTSLRDLRRNLQPIGLLAIGLVVFTMVAVAWLAHAAIDLPWASAFVLGAVVAPTDPIAATSIASRLGLPQGLIAVIEGESLINDGTALVAYRVAIGVVVGGALTATHVALTFVGSVVGGIAIGLGVGFVMRRVRRPLTSASAGITLSLLTGYLAYLPAELVGASAVLAAVTAGVYMGWHAPELTTVESRLQGDAVWTILQFVLNVLLFVLTGLQLPGILDAVGSLSTGRLLADAAIVVAAVLVTRIVWVVVSSYVPPLLWPPLRRHERPPWQHLAVVAWCGMRGAVSLAAALALPLATDAGAPFPGRALVIFLAFAVILATLLVQGLTLPALIGALRIGPDEVPVREEAKARMLAADAAMARLEELAAEDWVREDTAERMAGAYRFRRNRFAARFDDGDDGSIEARSLDYQRLRRELLEAERHAVRELRRIGRISDQVMRRVERDLDLEDARLDVE